MDLLKYLEPMKNLPKRFSNLAFWRDVRKFKDYVVNAFEYVDSWGSNIENTIDSVPNLNNLKITHVNITRFVKISFRKFSSITGAKKSIYFDKNTYTLDLECKVPTAGYLYIQFYAEESESATNGYNFSVPVLLYPSDGKCIMFLGQEAYLNIPTISDNPTSINISLHYFT